MSNTHWNALTETFLLFSLAIQIHLSLFNDYWDINDLSALLHVLLNHNDLERNTWRVEHLQTYLLDYVACHVVRGSFILGWSLWCLNSWLLCWVITMVACGRNTVTGLPCVAWFPSSSQLSCGLWRCSFAGHTHNEFSKIRNEKLE